MSHLQYFTGLILYGALLEFRAGLLRGEDWKSTDYLKSHALVERIDS